MIWDTVERERRRGAHHRRRRLRASAARHARRASRPLGSHRVARDHLVGRDVFSPEVKRGLLGHLPAVTMRRLARHVGRARAARPRARADDDDDRAGAVRGERPHPRGRRGRPGATSSPGATRSGWSRSAARIPLGYFKDPEKTAHDLPGVRRRALLGPGRLRDRRRRRDRCGSSGAARRASTPVGRRCTRRRSRPSCARTPSVFDCVVVGVPRRALRRAGGRAGAGDRRRQPRGGRAGRVVP